MKLTKSDPNTTYILCQECDRYMFSERGLLPVKAAKQIRISLIYSTLTGEKVIEIYETEIC